MKKKRPETAVSFALLRRLQLGALTPTQEALSGVCEVVFDAGRRLYGPDTILDALITRQRTSHLALIRQVMMAACYQHLRDRGLWSQAFDSQTGWSALGRMFNRDHTTIIYAVRCYRKDPRLQNFVRRVLADVAAGQP